MSEPKRIGDTPPRIGYWHLWTDADGVSHQTHCELARFEQASMGRPQVGTACHFA